MNSTTAALKIESRAKTRYRGAVSYGSALRLNHPRRRRVEGRVEVQDMATAVLDDEKPVQQPKRRARDCEQIHRNDVVLVVMQERYPSLHLVGLGCTPRQVSRHRHLGHDESELRKLRVDARCAPTILSHRPDEPANLAIHSRSSQITPPRDLCPVSSESIPIPPRDRVRVDDDQATSPPGPRLAERHPECAVGVVEERPGSLLLEHSNLLP